MTGEPWEYENWGDGEPNNSSNVVEGENCVAMWPEKWNDLASGNIYEQSGYICEWEATNDESAVEEDRYAGHVKNRFTQFILYLHGFTGKRLPILAESRETEFKRCFMGLH